MCEYARCRDKKCAGVCSNKENLWGFFAKICPNLAAAIGMNHFC